MGQASVAPFLVFVVPVVLVVSALWVYFDARSRQRSDRPVAVSIGTLTIEQPSVWAALCVVLFVVTLPLYLVARRAVD